MPETYTYELAGLTAQCRSEPPNHVTISTDDATIATAERGDFVRYEDGFGVALTDYDSDNEEITIAIRGGFNLPVHAANNAGDIAIYVLDWLYWDETDEEINKDDTQGIPVGQALEAVDSGEKATICISLEPTPEAL